LQEALYEKLRAKYQVTVKLPESVPPEALKQ
jgi:hypothetical protein